VQEGERVVVISGAPPGVSGSTNNVRVHTIGALGGA
jgi:pyruvate kinase